MSNNIQIFQAEQDVGLQHIIESNASIAYHAPALLHSKCDEDIACSLNSKAPTALNNYNPHPNPPLFLKASKSDDDIYHVYSILVSTSWNKNDDVFDKDEVWASKDTPKYKPTNLEHDEKQIVGGIIDNWAVDDNFNLLDEDIDINNLPDHYHILVSSVIYKQWQDPEYRNRVLELIEQIEAGDKYVSMECVFSGFDYAVVAPDNTYHVLARNDETAFLTQHLRAYGGTGAYQDHQVGRLLRNITFSGKGFVNKPANHESIIFDKNKIFEFNKASISSKSSLFNQNGVILKVDNPNILNTQESYDMSNEILSDQVAELKASLESVEADNKSLTDKLAEANVEKYEQSIKEQSEQLAVSAEQIETLTTELETAKTSVSELTTSFEAAKSERDILAGEVAEMYAAEKARFRQISLVEAGLSDAEAKAKIETFENLSDEQFDALVQTISTYIKVSETEVKSEIDVVASVDETIPETVDEEILETVKAEESVQLSVESDAVIDIDKDLDVVRAGLNDWVQTVILNTNNSKSGE